MGLGLNNAGSLQNPEASVNSDILTFEYSLFSFAMNKHSITAHKGIGELKESILIEVGEDRFVVADRSKKEVVQLNDEDLSGLKHNQILKCGERYRWEGDVLNDKPCGWGVLYENNHMLYEGFRVGERSVCYGIKYYTDTSKIEYEGEWCAGMRWGRGTQYDRNGEIVFKGEWMNDDHHFDIQVILTPENENALHSGIESLVVSNKCCNEKEWDVLDLSFMPALRELTVGDDCFGRVKTVRLAGLRRLEKVHIARNCCLNDGKPVQPSDGLTVQNCPALRELRIGYQSFYAFSRLVLENLPALESVAVDDYCFRHASGTQFVDLPSLKRVEVGRYCFAQGRQSCGSLVVRNCTAFEEVVVGDDSCYYATLCLESLPQLRAIDVGSNCFALQAEVKVVNLAKLETIRVGDNSFSCTSVPPGTPCVFCVSHCPSVKSITIGSRSFALTTVVELVGLDGLEEVRIGENSFWDGDENDEFREPCAESRFVLRDCPLVKALQIARRSFMNFGYCEIENNASLVSIAIGKLKSSDPSSSFKQASLTVRGVDGCVA